MRKYDPLMDYLDKCNKLEIKLSYAEIENIIGDKLPITASKRKEWWHNNDKTHSQSAAWSDVDYKVCDIVLGEYVKFRKVIL